MNYRSVNQVYTERGSLITKGTILKVNDTLFMVESMKATEWISPGHDFTFDVTAKTFTTPKSDEDVYFTKSEIEDMLDNKTLKIYNES
jgi:hypothetical protein